MDRGPGSAWPSASVRTSGRSSWVAGGFDLSLRRILLGCGVVSSLLYAVAINVLAPLVHPEYHSYTYRMVSELFAVHAPTRPLLGPPMIVYNLLVLSFAIGVWMSARGKRVTRYTAVALAAYFVVSTTAWFFASMDVRGTPGLTARNVVHVAATAVQGIAMLSALVLGGFVHGLRFRLYTFATLATCVVFGAFAGLLAAGNPSPWLGTAERVSIYAWLLWVGALAIAFLRAPEAKRTSAPAASLQGPKAERVS